jgi:hypothetical protein
LNKPQRRKRLKAFPLEKTTWQKIFKALSQPNRNAILTDGIGNDGVNPALTGILFNCKMNE